MILQLPILLLAEAWSDFPSYAAVLVTWASTFVKVILIIGIKMHLIIVAKN